MLCEEIVLDQRKNKNKKIKGNLPNLQGRDQNKSNDKNNKRF